MKKSLKLTSNVQQHIKKQYIITKQGSFQKSKDRPILGSFTILID